MGDSVRQRTRGGNILLAPVPRTLDLLDTSHKNSEGHRHVDLATDLARIARVFSITDANSGHCTASAASAGHDMRNAPILVLGFLPRTSGRKMRLPFARRMDAGRSCIGPTWTRPIDNYFCAMPRRSLGIPLGMASSRKTAKYLKRSKNSMQIRTHPLN
jgi:hypothetical protein